MFHLTVTQSFTMPASVAGQKGERFERGAAVRDADTVRRILESEFHMNVTKVSEGALDMPTDDSLYLEDARKARSDGRHEPGTAASGPVGPRDGAAEALAAAPVPAAPPAPPPPSRKKAEQA